jgi:arabinan endo-1,5-alpha-L-arabinosidase
MKFTIAALAIFLLIFQNSSGQSPAISVHDPVMIRQDGTYYIFCTGNGVSMFSSTDMVNWKKEKPVFEKAPDWVIKELPRFRNSMWAPDISFYKGNYYLFYSVSAFGRNTSCIGLAMNKTLRTESPDYKWVDLGCVIQSIPGRDNWNAIDPNLITDENGVPWMNFGSFWGGIKLVKLKDDLTGIVTPQEWYTIASRLREPFTNDRDAGSAQIEAPFIFKKDKYYYLFVSWDKCCSGVNSTYKVAVGRSAKVTGPYFDKDSVDMAKGGGYVFIRGDGDYPGVGHEAVVSFDGTDYILYHGYDAKDNGRSKLIIKKLLWDNSGWPYVTQKIVNIIQ